MHNCTASAYRRKTMLISTWRSDYVRWQLCLQDRRNRKSYVPIRQLMVSRRTSLRSITASLGLLAVGAGGRHRRALSCQRDVISLPRSPRVRRPITCARPVCSRHASVGPLLSCADASASNDDQPIAFISSPVHQQQQPAEVDSSERTRFLRQSDA